MYFGKCHQPENFRFPSPRACTATSWSLGKDRFAYAFDALGEDVYRLGVSATRWPEQYSQAELSPSFSGDSRASAAFSPRGGLSVKSPKGKALLTSQKGRSFGVSGQSWMMQFDYDRSMRFYGMGEKSFGFEHTGKHTKFWNTDVWADFDGNVFVNGAPDPMYLSIPYLIVKRGNDYVGILVNNPFAVFMSINPKVRIADQADAADGEEESRLFIGAPDGKPEVYFIVGPSLAELTRKLQRLVGTTPLPPLWSLGHQQCRWGYESYDDLDRLDQQFRKHKIPNDGLWLDIDYMTGYRVFTWNKNHWPNPAKQIADIQSRGQHVVPIFDPGVKVDPNYGAYRSGLKNKVFCQNPSGSPFVGFVWPGTTVFPDFSLERGRSWWARQVAGLAGDGITGCWLDMNDPATGLSENSEMLFGDGKLPHGTYHNQYALGMARATHAGMLRTHPDTRPFMLTRSGFISTNRYAAAWTGDNISNMHHLKNAIPMTLNLALSGLPFNGPDVPGFGGEPSAALAEAWYKAGFLFPFFRNHSNKECREQEPWTFGAKTTKVLRRYIRLRYKLLPYLYNLFVDQEETGEAIVRPLFYDFADSKKLPLDRIDDQFMIGPSLMQAPVLEPDGDRRRVALPKGRWFDAMAGKWVEGDRAVGIKVGADQTPLYIRDGAIVPMRVGEPTDNATDLGTIELHIFVSKGFRGKTRYTYVADDGKSFGYRRGERTRVRFEVSRGKKGLVVRADREMDGFGPIKVRVVDYAGQGAAAIRTGESLVEVGLRKHRVALTGQKLDVGMSGPVIV